MIDLHYWPTPNGKKVTISPQNSVSRTTGWERPEPRLRVSQETANREATEGRYLLRTNLWRSATDRCRSRRSRRRL